MTESGIVERGRKLCAELAEVLRSITDDQVRDVLDNGPLNEVMVAILDPGTISQYANLQEFLLANKWRASLIAEIRRATTVHYSWQGTNEEGAKLFISPHFVQWYEDGVMFLSGRKRFAGLIGLYKGPGDLSYAIAAHHVQKGEDLRRESLEFVDVEEVKKRAIANAPSDELREPLSLLQEYLQNQNNNESDYQELVSAHSWVFGLRYSKVDRHVKLDDRNIPDLIGTRARDGGCEFFEMKPPFTRMFRKDGRPSQHFNDAWGQAERYLGFVQRQADYLRTQKGLDFDNPRCVLVLGHDLTLEEIQTVRLKQRMNPLIEVLTYNDLVADVEHTVWFIESLKSKTGG